MPPRYKVIGKEAPRRPKREPGVYHAPDEVLWLTEDIAHLETMLWLLNRLQITSFIPRSSDKYEDRKNDAAKTLRRLAFIINYLKRTAEEILAREYLTDCKSTRPYRQSIAEVYLMIMDGWKAKD